MRSAKKIFPVHNDAVWLRQRTFAAEQLHRHEEHGPKPDDKSMKQNACLVSLARLYHASNVGEREKKPTHGYICCDFAFFTNVCIAVDMLKSRFVAKLRSVHCRNPEVSRRWVDGRYENFETLGISQKSFTKVKNSQLGSIEG